MVHQGALYWSTLWPAYVNDRAYTKSFLVQALPALSVEAHYDVSQQTTSSLLRKPTREAT
jgi:hypothetical protein